MADVQRRAVLVSMLLVAMFCGPLVAAEVEISRTSCSDNTYCVTNYFCDAGTWMGCQPIGKDALLIGFQGEDRVPTLQQTAVSKRPVKPFY